MRVVSLSNPISPPLSECIFHSKDTVPNDIVDDIFCDLSAFFFLGEFGQVARNEPGSSLTSQTRPKTLAADTKEQLALRWHEPQEEVPTLTLSVGVGTLLVAKEVVVLFAGSKRARALEAALEKSVNHMYPVSAFQRHKKVLFVCDEDAVLELKVKTVRAII